MSLGLNPHRTPRRSTLPGSLGANVVQASALLSVRKVPTRIALPRSAPATTTPPPPASSVKNTTPVAPIPSPPAATDWVYATAGVPLYDLDSKLAVCEAGDRVLLVYPMEEDDEAMVKMRLKRADVDTGQLSYHWVHIHNLVSDESFVTHFGV